MDTIWLELGPFLFRVELPQSKFIAFFHDAFPTVTPRPPATPPSAEFSWRLGVEIRAERAAVAESVPLVERLSTASFPLEPRHALAGEIAPDRQEARLVATWPEEVLASPTSLKAVWHTRFLLRDILSIAAPLAGGLVFHASAYHHPTRGGILTPAKSGTGKSTLARFAAEKGWRLFGDEAVLAAPRGHDGPFLLHPLPFFADAKLEAHRGPTPVPLAAVCFPRQSTEENRLEPLADPGEIIPELLGLAIVQQPADVVNRAAMRAAERLFEQAPCYRLHFRNQPGCLDVFESLPNPT